MTRFSLGGRHRHPVEPSPNPAPHRLLVDGRWRRPVIELACLVIGVGLFSWLHNLAGTDVAAATANAHALQSVERALDLDVEVSANHWLAGHAVLVTAAVLWYRLYYLPLAGVLLWLLFRHPQTYRVVRRTLTVMAPLALLVFWLVPVSPPRFALPGIVDIVATHDLFGSTASVDLANGQNHFSAMPSLHVGWSALCAYGAWLALRPRHSHLALLVWLFPAIMVAVVIATGNHYVLDVLGSAVLLALSIGAARAWEHLGRQPSTPVTHRPTTDRPSN